MQKKTLSILLCITFAVLIAFPVSVGAPTAHVNWSMFHQDLALSGVSPSTAPNTNDTLWIYPTGSPVFSSPAIVDGILYVGCTDGNLYALDADTGTPIWTYPTRGPIYSSPAVADGKVYFLSTDGNLYAIDAITGAFVWNAFFGFGSWHWSSPAIHDGKVFIGASNGWIHCLDAGTGTTIWSTPTGGQPNSPITVVNGKVYSGTHNFGANIPTLFALDEDTGAVIWTYSHTDWYPQTVGMINCNGVAVVDGDEDGDLEVYFGIVTWGQAGNEAICLDEAAGNPIWTYNLNGWSTSTPAVHDGKVFIGSDDGNLYALTADTGSLVWTYPTGGQVWSAPAVADGKVFFGSLDHIFYAVDEATGNLVWSYNTGLSRIMGSPGVADGIVFVGNENGKVYAFGMRPGKVTGGGQIALSPKAKASFGFNVMYQEGWAAPKGELQYVDHNINMKVHSNEMTSLVVSPDKTKATFEGTCTIDGVSGFTFKVYVEDNGEPGKNDVFKISLSNGYSAGGTLLNGNIQIHKKP